MNNNFLKGYSTQFLLDLKWSLDLRYTYQKQIMKKCGCTNRKEFLNLIANELKNRKGA